MLPKFFDTDQHLSDPPDFLAGRLPKKYEEMAPKRFGQGDAKDADPERFTPKRRIELMNLDGIGATVMFGNGASMISRTQDDEFYLEYLRVYNDALMDWSVAGDAKRIFPAAHIPAIGVEHAMAELERTAKKGFKHYLFNRWPSGNSSPSSADDPFWALAEETGMVISFHGFGPGRPTVAPVAVAAGQVNPHARDLGQVAIAALRGAGLGATYEFGSFIMNGILERHPNLKVALIETSVGWVPYFAERLDSLYAQHRWLGAPLERLPSESIKKVKISFDREWLGVQYRDFVGVENIIFGTDYPHVGHFCPHTRAYLELVFRGVPAEDQEKMLWSNAASLYGVN